MSTINELIGMCLGSIAVTFFVMVVAANLERLLTYSLGDDEE